MMIKKEVEEQQPKKKKKIKRDILCMQVYGNKIFFNQYLQQQIGAPWQHIKNALYDAGYSCTEVNEYRNGLLEDFRKVCEKYHLNGII